MSIRRQSIISSLVIYCGFAVGALNTYLFNKEGYFTGEEYGLTTIFVSVSIVIQSFACMAMPVYIMKFHPYYEHNLPPDKNDMPAIALTMGLLGFLLTLVAGIVFKQLVVHFYAKNSPEFVAHYYWVFPMGFGFTMYTILEAYTWSIRKPVLAGFLKELLWRFFTTVLIALFIWGVLTDFSEFIKLYSLTYILIASVLFVYLYKRGKLNLTLTISKVTRRYFKKIISLCSFVYGGVLIFTISQVFDTLVIAAILEDGLQKAGVFTLATFVTSILQVPQRAVEASSVSHISNAWREKDIPKIQRIYQRSSINMLLFGLAIYFLIALNYRDAVVTLGLKPALLNGFYPFIFLGLTRLVEMGVGVNKQILATSTYWRFELTSGVILLTVMLPLSYFLALRFDILGPSIANLISICIYSAIRIGFLWRKFKLQPFSVKSVYTILIGIAAFATCYFLLGHLTGFLGLMVKAMTFILLYGAGIIFCKVSPDIQPVIETAMKRLGISNTKK